MRVLFYVDDGASEETVEPPAEPEVLLAIPFITNDQHVL